MLTYFPTPYPDEWWYSVLCRYYTRTGIREHALVKERLFKGRKGAHMGTLFPNGTLAQVTAQLLQSAFDTREIILNHTPYLYYARMYPENERKAMLESLCRGETVQITHIWKSCRRALWRPRYCPVCAREDRERYGEPYWHTDHQIPLMTVCTKHGCRLQQIELETVSSALNQQFLPLAEFGVKDAETNYRPWEAQVSKVVREYWRMPLTVGPTLHNNLVQGLKDKGYLAIYRQGNVTLDPQKLYADLCAFYGPEKVDQCFGGSLDASMVNRIVQWKQLLPDRYILLQVMIGMPTAEVFGDKAAPDCLRERLERIAAERRFCTIKQVAEQLNLKRYELNTLLHHYGMEAFWMRPEKSKHAVARKGLLRCTVDESERELIEQRAKELGYRCAGAFVLDCVRYVMKRGG